MLERNVEREVEGNVGTSTEMRRKRGNWMIDGGGLVPHSYGERRIMLSMLGQRERNPEILGGSM